MIDEYLDSKKFSFLKKDETTKKRNEKIANQVQSGLKER